VAIKGIGVINGIGFLYVKGIIILYDKNFKDQYEPVKLKFVNR